MNPLDLETAVLILRALGSCSGLPPRFLDLPTVLIRMAYGHYMTEMHGASVYTEEHLESLECTQ